MPAQRRHYTPTQTPFQGQASRHTITIRDQGLAQAIAAWAAAEERSFAGQVQYLLRQDIIANGRFSHLLQTSSRQAPHE